MPCATAFGTRSLRNNLRSASCAVIACALLAGCATPLFKGSAPTTLTPADAAGTHGSTPAEVIWGGRIIGMRNLASTSELDVLSLPLDRAQRPRTRAQSTGRFMVVLDGFVEPLDFPPGRYVTVRAHFSGSRDITVDGHPLAVAVVDRAEIHTWPPEFPNDRGHFTFGVGVGVGIH